MIRTAIILERKCSQCGKKFIVTGSAEQWVYKIRRDKRDVWFCSWHCLRAAEKAREADIEKKRKNLSEGAKRGWETRRMAMG